MSGFQNIKAKAREHLHEHMARAVALTYQISPGVTQARDVTGRYHSEMKKVGDLAGTNLSYAEVAERPAQIVFWQAELDDLPVDLSRGFYAVFSDTEGYFVDNVHPADGLTRTADVTPLRPEEMSGLHMPGGNIIP